MNRFKNEWDELDNIGTIIKLKHILAIYCALYERINITNRGVIGYIFNNNANWELNRVIPFCRTNLVDTFNSLCNNLLDAIKVLVDEDYFNLTTQYSGSKLIDYYTALKMSTISRSFLFKGGNAVDNAELLNPLKEFKDVIKPLTIYTEGTDSIIISDKGWDVDISWYESTDHKKPEYSEPRPDIILQRFDSKRFDNHNNEHQLDYTFFDCETENNDYYLTYKGQCITCVHNIFIPWRWALSGKISVFVEGVSRKYVTKGFDYDWEEVSADFFDFGTDLKLGWNEIDHIFKLGDVVKLAKFGEHPYTNDEGVEISGDEEINISDGSYSINFPGKNEHNVKYECGLSITKIKIDFTEGLTYK